MSSSHRTRLPAHIQRRRVAGLFAATAALLVAAADRPARAQATEGDPGNALPFNGFKVDRSLLPLDEIVRGGPPRDGIPAIDQPRFVAARRARLAPSDRVLGVSHRGIARAYPVRILNWHEVVNDRFGDEPVAVTYCPLCGSGVVFSGRAGERALTFGVSGLLYNSDMLLYDRQTESLWSQLKFQSVTGPLIGSRLARLPVEHTSWQDWQRRYPHTEVLSFETGYPRDYGRDPYAGYERDPATFFPVSRSDSRLDPKAWVLGVEVNGRHKAYPFSELEKAGTVVRDSVAGTRITVHFDAKHRSARAVDDAGRDLAAVTAFWFAWAAFNPATDVYTSAAGRR
jgi:hypothetical protein